MFMLLLFSICLSQSLFGSATKPTTFSFPFFHNDSCTDGRLICTGSVTGWDGYLSLTPELEPGNSTSPLPSQLPLNKVGRVLFHQPVVAWPAVISTTFTIRISSFPNTSGSGDGMSFIIAQDDKPSPPDSYGSYLGIMDGKTNVRQIAVEIDTYRNEFDIDGNHIGIDTTSIINPVAAKSLNNTGIDLKSGRDITLKIYYHAWDNLLRIYMAYTGDQLKSFLNHSIKLADTVPNNVYVGFTASTGIFPESHQVLNWVFTSIPL